MTIYAKTATKAKNKAKTVYAFGRKDELDGQPVTLGGYGVWKLCENYAGHVRGGVSKTWRYIALDLAYNDALALMNKRLGYTAFKAAA